MNEEAKAKEQRNEKTAETLTHTHTAHTIIICARHTKYPARMPHNKKSIARQRKMPVATDNHYVCSCVRFFYQYRVLSVLSVNVAKLCGASLVLYLTQCGDFWLICTNDFNSGWSMITSISHNFLQPIRVVSMDIFNCYSCFLFCIFECENL